MEWLLPLILQVVVPTDSLMQVMLNKSLAQVIQEQISCRKEFDEATHEFEQANAIDDPFQRLNAIDKNTQGCVTTLRRAAIMPETVILAFIRGGPVAVTFSVIPPCEAAQYIRRGL
jgi:hypothetical protein